MANRYLEPQSYFDYWEDCSTNIKVDADPPENRGIPYHVYIGTEWSSMLSLLVWANSEYEALWRVFRSMQICAEKEYNRDSERNARNMMQRIVNAIWSGEAKAWAVPYDTRKIAAKVIWSSNGGW